MRGKLHYDEIASELLAGFTHAGVDAKRPLHVYVPAEVGESSQVPVLYCLAPWTSAGRAQFGWKAFREPLTDRIDRLIAQGTLPPVVVASPDLFSDVFGGSQYIDSDYLGPHARHLVEEVFPYVERHFPVSAEPSDRGVFGRSSGGFGGLRLAMDYPGSIGYVAAHSSDMGFELLFGSELIALAKALARYDGDVKAYLQDLSSKTKVGGGDMHVLMLLGMAASYSPADKGKRYDLPIDLRTGAFRSDVLERWYQHDPVKMEKKRLQNLQTLKKLYLECGTRDQYNLLYGHRQFHERLTELSIHHRYEEFDDNHSGTDYRYDISLPFLYAD